MTTESDWDDVNFKLVEEAVHKYTDIETAYLLLCRFADQVERLRDKQLKQTEKQVPALFKPLIAGVNRGE